MAVVPTETSLTWAGGTLFETIGPGGDRLQIDSPPEKGGGGAGFSPMTLLLHAVAACMSVTVVQILAKQRLHLETYRLDIRGARAQEPPSPYIRIVMTHRMHGTGLTQANVERLVHMVEERYCSVAATLPRGLIEHDIVLSSSSEQADQEAETAVSS